MSAEDADNAERLAGVGEVGLDFSPMCLKTGGSGACATVVPYCTAPHSASCEPGDPDVIKAEQREVLTAQVRTAQPATAPGKPTHADVGAITG